MLKKISIKFFLINVLVLLIFTLMIITSYISVDSYEQHLIFTNLLGEQNLLIERINFETRILARKAINDRFDYNILLEPTKKEILKDIKEIDKIFRVYETKRYVKLDGEVYDLEFRKEFEDELTPIMSNVRQKWEQTKYYINQLLTKDIEDIKNYEKIINKLKFLNIRLQDDSDDLMKLCKKEAENKEKISNIIQILSFVSSIAIFLFFLYLLNKDIYRPIKDIRAVFKKIGSGDINTKLKRRQNDEFKLLYNDFNHFIDNLKYINKIEDQILVEEELNKILLNIEKNFKPFVDFNEFGIKYRDINDNVVVKIPKNDTVENKVLEEKYLELYNQIEKYQNSIYVPIKINEANLGYAYFKFNSDEEIKDEYLNFLSFLQDKIAFAFYKSFLFSDLLNFVTDSLADMAESRDPETGKHLLRMSTYSKIIAKKLYIKGDFKDVIDLKFVENILITAPMHDIGKVAIPDNILLKPDKLTKDEFNIMRQHSYAGYKVLINLHNRFSKYKINYFKIAADIAYSHHEKFDGTGYPRKFKGSNIPLASRIVAVADVFDALSSKRPYKEAFPLDRCYKIISEGKGTHFDPKIVEAFFESKQEIEEIYEKYKEI